MPLIKAAQFVRGDDGTGFDIRDIFHRVGEKYDGEMSFEAEMIAPRRLSENLFEWSSALHGLTSGEL